MTVIRVTLDAKAHMTISCRLECTWPYRLDRDERAQPISTNTCSGVYRAALILPRDIFRSRRSGIPAARDCYHRRSHDFPTMACRPVQRARVPLASLQYPAFGDHTSIVSRNTRANGARREKSSSFIGARDRSCQVGIACSQDLRGALIVGNPQP